MGLSNLVDAMKQVIDREPDAILYIAGKGRLKAQLEAQIASHGLADHVKLLGFVTDAQLPLIYRAADLNVVPTLSLEGFGLVAAEALAAGTPSLVTPVGGLPEVVSGLSPDLVFASSATAISPLELLPHFQARRSCRMKRPVMLMRAGNSARSSWQNEPQPCITSWWPNSQGLRGCLRLQKFQQVHLSS